ncbi:MAG: 2-phospho-L-lactate guanylyltransferase [Rhodospirillales bacterium]|nr:2-phospho-L-lactate guanylyltransferase [Rhodospirillales bacterium]
MSRNVPVFALVPVRALSEGKKRLAPLLAPLERVALARVMLEDMLDCLSRSPAVEGIAVVTGDPDAADLASSFGALALPDSPPGGAGRSTIGPGADLAAGSFVSGASAPGGLNASLEAAAAWVRATRPDCAILVLPADVPAAHPSDIAALLAEDSAVALARAEDGGTNALLLRPGVALPFAFGPESCARHAAAARAAGLSVAVVARANLALDLDRPADVARYLARAGSSRTLGLLHRLGVPSRLRAREKAQP